MRDAKISNQEASSDEKRSLEGMIIRLDQMDCLKKRLEHVVEVGECLEDREKGNPGEVLQCIERVNDLLRTISNIRQHYINEIINAREHQTDMSGQVLA